MPVIVDASIPFDVAGERFSARDDSRGFPAHLMWPMFLRRAFRDADEVGAVSAEWAVVEFAGRLYNGRPTQVTGDGREAAVSTYRLATNFGGIASGDQIASDEGWWRIELPSRPPRGVWQVAGDPYPVSGAHGTVHHYEVEVRRVDG